MLDCADGSAGYEAGSGISPGAARKAIHRHAVESRQEWSGIYLKGSKIGYSSSEIKRIEEGYQITEEVFMDLTVMDMPQRIQTQVNAVVDGDMRLQIFSFRLTSGVISMSVSGTVQGQRMRLQYFHRRENRVAGYSSQGTARAFEQPTVFCAQAGHKARHDLQPAFF